MVRFQNSTDGGWCTFVFTCGDEAPIHCDPPSYTSWVDDDSPTGRSTADASQLDVDAGSSELEGTRLGDVAMTMEFEAEQDVTL